MQDLKREKAIFLFLKNPLFISDLLKTNYIQYLASQYKVLVFSSVIDEEVSRRLASVGAESIRWTVQNPRLFAVTKFLRTACIREFSKVSSLQFYYGSPAFQNDKRAKLLRWLSAPFARWMTINFFTGLEAFLMGRSRVLEEYCKRYKPSLFVTATPGIQIFDAEIILYGKKIGIPTLATNLSWDNLTSFKCVRSRRPDYLFVWNEVLKEAAMKVHRFPAEKIFITGSMRFDKYFDKSHPLPSREDFLTSKGLNPQYPTLLFASGGRAPRQPEVLAKIISARNQKKIPWVNFLVRPHPFDDPEFYRPLAGEKDISIERLTKANKEFAPGESAKNSFINLKATLAYTEININHKSTISLESFLFDKPVINFMDPAALFQNKHYSDEGSYYYPLIREKAVFVAQNDDDLIAAINSYIKNPTRDSGNRKRVAEKFFAFQDGKSYQRNVDLLSKII
ncbi:MAG: CDP-glycerol glycerophosphotransferase family protein [Patescibacteria group bacterium]